MNRPPDIDTENQPIPDGCTLIIGKRLMFIARPKQIPWGLAYRVTGFSSTRLKETLGIIIFTADQERWDAAVALKEQNKWKKANPATPEERDAQRRRPRNKPATA